MRKREGENDVLGYFIALAMVFRGHAWWLLVFSTLHTHIFPNGLFYCLLGYLLLLLLTLIYGVKFLSFSSVCAISFFHPCPFHMWPPVLGISSCCFQFRILKFLKEPCKESSMHGCTQHWCTSILDPFQNMSKRKTCKDKWMLIQIYLFYFQPIKRRNFRRQFIGGRK